MYSTRAQADCLFVVDARHPLRMCPLFLRNVHADLGVQAAGFPFHSSANAHLREMWGAPMPPVQPGWASLNQETPHENCWWCFLVGSA